MSIGRRAAALVGAAALVAGALSGCESAEERQAEHDLAQAADQTTCRADASPAPTPYGDGFPEDWPFPPQTTVFHTEDRGADGTIVTAVSSAPFQDVLAFLNGPVADAGFEVEKGETEEHDAEAEWSGGGFRGRWAIRESAQCSGETVIQVLSTRS
ncbi:MAG: hypothetical protein ACTHKG_19170 [Nocardioides sp.]